MCCMITALSNAAEPVRRRLLTPYEAAISGTVAGMAELITGNPLQNTKIRLQQGLRPTLDPRIWYKNAALTAMCMGPTTMVQGVCNEKLKTLAGGPCLQAAAASGLASGFLAAPMDAVAQYRLTMGTSIPVSMKEAPLFKGLTATLPRELFWSSALFYLRPEWVPIIQSYVGNEKIAQGLAGASAGVLAAVVSHPCDTVATVTRQAVLQQGMPPEMLAKQKEILPPMRHELDAIKYINAMKGWRGYYPGVAFRAMRAGVGVPVIGTIYDALARHIVNRKE